MARSVVGMEQFPSSPRSFGIVFGMVTRSVVTGIPADRDKNFYAAGTRTERGRAAFLLKFPSPWVNVIFWPNSCAIFVIKWAKDGC